MTKRKKILIACACIFLSVALLAGVSCTVYFNLHRIFIFGQEHGWGRDEVTFEILTPETKKVTLAEAEGDESIVFDDSLMLVNTAHTIPDEYVWSISEYKDTDVYMNDCMKEAYASLSAGVTQKTGKKLYVSSDLRTKEEQEALYREDPNTATLPGASEHETGLCVDVYVAYYAGDSFLKSDAGRYVNAHAHEYGFIIRYPSYGEDKTGIRFEPWHIRYVGEVHASYIYNNSLTLEEYINGLSPGVFYKNGSYVISRQPAGESIQIHSGAKHTTVSPDNTGYYIVTSEIEMQKE